MDYRNCLLNCESCVNIHKNTLLGYLMLDFVKNEKLESQDISVSRVFFVIEGSISVTCGIFNNVIFKKNQFGFLPKNINRHGLVLEDSKILTVSVPNFGSICGSVALSESFRLAKQTVWDFKPLEFNATIQKYINTISYYVSTGINCDIMHKIKVTEFVLLLKRTYSLEQIVPFLHPIIGYEQNFRDVVLDNYRNVTTVKELADIAGMNMTTFNLKFKDEFGEAPLAWIQKRKADAIKYQIMYTDCGVADLIQMFDFSSGSDFVKFCRRHFGCAPSVLIHDLRS